MMVPVAPVSKMASEVLCWLIFWFAETSVRGPRVATSTGEVVVRHALQCLSPYLFSLTFWSYIWPKLYTHRLHRWCHLRRFVLWPSMKLLVLNRHIRHLLSALTSAVTSFLAVVAVSTEFAFLCFLSKLHFRLLNLVRTDLFALVFGVWFFSTWGATLFTGALCRKCLMKVATGDDCEQPTEARIASHELLCFDTLSTSN